MSDDAKSYAALGVNYKPLDKFKRICQSTAATTQPFLRHRFREPAGVRGESAYILELDDSFIAHVEEGLGTKNLVADAVRACVHRPYFAIGIDTVASIINDILTVGALPTAVAMHAAVGDAEWFGDLQRATDLVEGFAEGCRLSGAVWGGGETPVLKDIVAPNAIVLAGSAFGTIHPKGNRILGNIVSGDRIVFLESSGIHANGITMCRSVAASDPNGYNATLSDGTQFGETLMLPSYIYVKFIEECFNKAVVPKYAVNMTGHGWRKLMRPEAALSYVINKIPPIPPLFTFLMDRTNLSHREAYATFNMGVGFAVYVSEEQVAAVLEAAATAGIHAWEAGEVVNGARSVILPEYDITYGGTSLDIRG